ncbi:hypothetical protein LTR28_003898 [Elasticomyces elasticus]|nr:hypothetical protein LTR28_003898 [Elasticomyces elasticus]
MRLALSCAKQSPPKSSNYCVGAVIVSPSSTPAILATGYTLELPGNTHAEQCCLQKLASGHGIPEERVGEVLPPDAELYTTMEPCNLRLSGNTPCVDRILAARFQQSDGKVGGIQKVYIGVKEPEKFVGENEGRKKLEDAGVEVVHLPGMEDEILTVATAGHVKG